LANISSQIKRNRQNEKRRLRNRNFRGAARTAVKDALSSMSGGQDSAATVLAAISALDKAAQKGAIHHRNAARRKGRLLKRLAALQPAGALGQQPKPAMADKPGIEKTRARADKADSSPKAKTEVRKPAAKPAEKKTAPKKTATKKPAKS
jgi:small subunit ribosomal protein S20